MQPECKRQIAQAMVSAWELDDQTDWQDSKLGDLGVNSLKFIRLIVDVEELFDTEVDDELLNMARYSCAGDLLEALASNAARACGGGPG